jgi:hypothetical protein
MRIAHLALLVPALCMAQDPPRLALDATRHDFGRVLPDARSFHRFRLTNAGGAPLKILGLHPSCGCTSTVLGKDALAPGESTELEVTFNAVGLRGPARKSVVIATNDPARPNQELFIDADVLADVSATPEEVRFQGLTPRDRRKATVKLESATSEPLTLTDVTLSLAPWLGVATREEGRVVYLDLDLAARLLPPGQLAGTDTIAVHVLNPRPSVVEVKVVWEAQAPVVLTPGRISFTGAARSAKVALKARDGKPFRVLSARTTNPLVTVSPLPAKAAARQELHVTLAKTAGPGTYDETVFLTVDAPGKPELPLRVTASLP